MDVNLFLVKSTDNTATFVNLHQLKSIFVKGETISIDLGGGLSHQVAGEDAKSLLLRLMETSILPDATRERNVLGNMGVLMDDAIARKVKAQDAEERLR